MRKALWKLRLLWWELKWWLLDTKWTDTSEQLTLTEIAADWTWRWEFQDKFEGVTFNIGTKENPEWATMR